MFLSIYGMDFALIGYYVKPKLNPKQTEIFVFVALFWSTGPFALTFATVVALLPDGLVNQ